MRRFAYALILLLAFALIGSACSESQGKTEVVSFTSEDGSRKCEAWKEGGRYHALCLSCAGPEMFLRAAEEYASPGSYTSCFDGEDKGCYYVNCSSDESLADFIK